MRKKLLPLIGIAFAVAVIATAVFYSLVAGRMSASSGMPQQATIVIAARDLKTGTVLTAEDLGLVPWAGGKFPGGTFSNQEQALGQTVLDNIPRGEPLVQSRLISKDGTGFAIPKGMRAVSIHVSDSSGVVDLLRPGFKVDVQVFGSRSPRMVPEGLRTLLRGITVLSVIPQPEASSQGYFNAPVVTLVAPVEHAEQLALADSYARLRLTLRNPLEPVATRSRRDARRVSHS